MFVHGVKPGQPLVLMVKQDEKGLALKHAVLKKCPSIPSSFILMHQGRKVIKKYGNCRGVFWLALAGIQIEIAPLEGTNTYFQEPC